MIQTRTRRLGPSLLVAAGSFGIVACNEAGFRDSAQAKNPASLSGNARPETPDLERPGWIGDKVKDAFRNAFDEASIGSGGPNGPNGSGGANGPGGSAGAGGSPADELLNGVDGVLWIPCGSDASKINEFSADFMGKKGSKVRLSGEFCPAGKVDQITVLFVIDHSGSMEGGVGINEGPNDKTSGGSCGRLTASKVLVEKYAALKSTKVQAGVVNFSSRANIEVPITDLSEMQKSLDGSTFCGLDRNGGMTNYEDAMKFARNALKDVEGPKVVYFVTDGAPTVAGSGGRVDLPNAAAAGLRAAQDLREMDDLTLYALFVGYKGGGAGNPRSYLEQITGSADNVRVVADAEELTKAAASLGVGTIKLSKSDAKITLNNPAGDRGVNLARLGASPSKAGGIHIWVTEPFVLVGTKEQVVVNTVTATVKVPNGADLQTVANIRFQQID